MRGGEHLIVGIASGGVVLWTLRSAGLPVEMSVIYVGAAVGGIGALLPDIDHPQALASKSLPRTLVAEALNLVVPLLLLAGFFAAFAGREVGASLISGLAPIMRWAGVAALAAVILFVLSAIARALTGHRGATHSVGMLLIATLLATIAATALSAPWWYGLLLGLGWLTHLATDALTPAGLSSLFWPFDRLRAPTPVRPVPPPVAEQQPQTSETLAASGDEVPLCPRCGLPMVLRTARRGAHQGERFYGCANFPRCRQVQKIEPATLARDA